MSINLRMSNNLKNLVSDCAEDISRKKSFFKKNIIITQTSGMQRWLSLKIAQLNGIFANFKFLNPNDFFDKYLFYDLLKSDESIINRESFKWIIFRIFQDKKQLIESGLENLLSYTSGDDVKLYRFCDVLADLFDQYIVYREKMIANWSLGKKFTNCEHEIWQLKLFNIIQSYYHSDQKHYLDRRELKERFIDKIIAQDKKLLKKILDLENIYFFGISTLTDYHLELLSIISRIIDINFYLINPSSEYWYDIMKDVPTLESNDISSMDNKILFFLNNYGQYAKEFYYLFFKYFPEVLDSIDQNSFQELPEERSLLDKVRNSIFKLECSTVNIEKDISLDNSIQISSCHTIFREVEVLYDQILLSMEKDSSLSCSDILVMLTDVNLYRPYIETIFKKEFAWQPYLNFKIADQDYLQDNDPLVVILNIFDLYFTNYEINKIINLLRSPFISKKFGIDNLETVIQLVEASKIKWGLQESDNIIKGSSYSFIHSLEYGLKRIVLGYAMQKEFCLEDNLYPLDIVEGEDALVGLRFYGFYLQLVETLEQLSIPKSLQEWGEFSLEIFHKFIHLDFEEQVYLDNFEKLVNQYKSDEIKVSFSVFRDDFSKKCQNLIQTGHFITSGITFCSLVPMRSIPHKFIAILGLNENTFPPLQQYYGFDLLQHTKQVGDRDRKKSHKYLFLEALISAENYFYLSFCGRSPLDNSIQNSSQAILDLVDLIADISNIDKDVCWDLLIKEYPLYGYSREYQDKFSTYRLNNDLSNNSDSLIYTSKEKNIVINNDVVIDKSDIDLFFKNPLKYFYNKKLGIYLHSDKVSIKTKESFLIEDNLVKWNLKNDLSQEQSCEDILKDYRFKLGQIPLGKASDVAIKKISDDIFHISNTFQDLVSGKSSSEIEIDLLNTRGKINNIYEKKQIVMSLGHNLINIAWKAYLNHLWLISIDKEMETIIIDKDYNNYTEKGVIVFRYTDKMQRLLYDFLSIFHKNKDRLFIFHPLSSYEYCRTLRFPRIKKDGNIYKSDLDPYENAKKIFLNKELSYDIYLQEKLQESFYPPDSKNGIEFMDNSKYLMLYFTELMFESLKR